MNNNAQIIPHVGDILLDVGVTNNHDFWLMGNIGKHNLSIDKENNFPNTKFNWTVKGVITPSFFSAEEASVRDAGAIGGAAEEEGALNKIVGKIREHQTLKMWPLEKIFIFLKKGCVELNKPDTFDALCVVAGHDFVKGTCFDKSLALIRSWRFKKCPNFDQTSKEWQKFFRTEIEPKKLNEEDITEEMINLANKFRAMNLKKECVSDEKLLARSRTIINS